MLVSIKRFFSLRLWGRGVQTASGGGHLLRRPSPARGHIFFAQHAFWCFVARFVLLVTFYEVFLSVSVTAMKFRVVRLEDWPEPSSKSSPSLQPPVVAYTRWSHRAWLVPSSCGCHGAGPPVLGLPQVNWTLPIVGRMRTLTVSTGRRCKHRSAVHAPGGMRSSASEAGRSVLWHCLLLCRKLWH